METDPLPPPGVFAASSKNGGAFGGDWGGLMLCFATPQDARHCDEEQGSRGLNDAEKVDQYNAQEVDGWFGQSPNAPRPPRGSTINMACAGDDRLVARLEACFQGARDCGNVAQKPGENSPN